MNRKLYPNVPVSDVVAAAFFLSKGVSSSVEYLYTVFDVLAWEDIADVFTCGEYLVKTDMSRALEWYKYGHTMPDGEQVLGVSMDLETGAPIDYYRATPRGVTKTGADGVDVDTAVCGYLCFPEDMKELLREFPFKSDIRAYSINQNRTVVEYVRTWGPLHVPS